MKILALVLLLPTLGLACEKGQTEWKGNCTVDLKPAESAKGDPSAWVSNEKPPKTTTGEWQTGKTEIIQLNSQTIDDEIATKIAWDKAHPYQKAAQAQ